MFQPIVFVTIGILFLIIAFRAQWFSVRLKRELLAKPKVATRVKWCGIIVLSLGILEFLALLLGIL